jgi:thiamine-monophosphate kinase
MSALTEFQLIERFTRPAPRAGAGVALGIGDDAAVLRAPSGADLVATVDAVVEGVHFDGRFSPEDVGWKALAVNLSDLAAMGARPLWALCALALPPGASATRLVGVGGGLADCARRFGVTLVGGNVTRAARLSLTVTLLGAAARGRALTRGGARAGDLLVLSGALGGAALGLLPGAPAEAVRRQRRPVPRVALGMGLAGVASACIDVSDGFLQDLGHLCDASRLRAEVWLPDLPASPGVLARRNGRRLLLAGGEEYELLAAVPPGKLDRALAVARRLRVPLHCVGTLGRGKGVRILDAHGRRIAAGRGGYDHLRAR